MPRPNQRREGLRSQRRRRAPIRPHLRSASLALLLVLTTFAIGGVHDGTSAVFEIGIWCLAAATLLIPSFRGTQQLPLAFRLPAGLLIAYLALYLLPLPPAVLAALSPATADLHRNTIDRVVPLLGAPAPISSVGSPEHQSVSIVQRRRIQDLAKTDNDTWRPLALNPFAARSDLLRYLAYGFALILAATTRRPGTLLGGLALTGFLSAGFAIIQHSTWNGKILWFFQPYEAPDLSTFDQMFGPFVNPDHFAGFLAMLLFPAATVAARLRRLPSESRASSRMTPWWARPPIWITGFGLALMIAALVGTASRGALVGVILGGLIFSTGARLEARRRPASRSRSPKNPAERIEEMLRRSAPAFVLLGVLAAGLLFAGERGCGVLDTRLGTGAFESSVGFRFTTWSQTWPLIRDFPIFGVGPGCWREIFRRYESYPLTRFSPNHAHNDYLEWLAEVGALGIVLSLLLTVGVGRWIRQNHACPPLIRFALLASIAVGASHSLVDFGLRTPAYALGLAFVIGLACNQGFARAEVPPSPSVARSRLATVSILAALCLLSLASARQLHEFLVWARVRNGSAEIHSAPANGATWELLGRLLAQSGYRYHPPTPEVFLAGAWRRPTGQDTYWYLSRSLPRRAQQQVTLEAALYLHPTNAVWRVAYASLLAGSGRTQDALKEIEEAAFRDPRPNAQRHLRSRNQPGIAPIFEAAQRGFRRALAEHPRNLQLLHDVATFHEQFGLWNEAAALWLRAADEDEDWFRFGMRAAEGFAQGGNLARAEKVYREALRVRPHDPDPYVRLALGILAPEQRLVEAEAVLQEGLRRSRAVGGIHVALARIRHRQGDELGAQDALKEASQSGYWSVRVQTDLAEAYREVGNLSGAREALERAIALEPSNPALRYQLGRVLEAQYDLHGARESFRAAIKLDPRNADYRQRLGAVTRAIAEAAASSTTIH